MAQLSRIKGLPGVEDAQPYIVGKGLATLPNGGFEDVWIIGCDAASWMGAPNLTTGSKGDLATGDRVSIDELDRPKLGNVQVGDIIEINGNRAKVSAMTNGLLGFMTTPNLFTNLSAARRFANLSDAYCHYFLVKAKAGTDVTRLAAANPAATPRLGRLHCRGIWEEFRETIG